LLWLTAIKIISFDPNSMGETRFLINKEVLNVELQKFGGFWMAEEPLLNYLSRNRREIKVEDDIE
jgi:hypothetical protein